MSIVSRIPGRCLLPVLLLIAFCISTAGCEQGARSLSLDKDLARESFRSFMEAWKAGKSPQDLQQSSPAIIAADPDWKAGHRLVGWQRVPGETDDGVNLYLTVDFTLAETAGRKTQQRVVYVVGTEPVITIFRR